MTVKNKTAWLKRYMKKHGHTRVVIAELVCVNISTVDRWLVPDDMSSHREMPDMGVKLLDLIAKYEPKDSK